MYQPWMNHISVGDVLKDANGTLRVVRSVAYRKQGRLAGRLLGVAFAIKRCSWTGRCYTHVGFNDLAMRGFKPTGIRRKLLGKIDRKIAHDLEYDNRFKPQLTCCDIRGVP